MRPSRGLEDSKKWWWVINVPDAQDGSRGKRNVVPLLASEARVWHYCQLCRLNMNSLGSLLLLPFLLGVPWFLSGAKLRGPPGANGTTVLTCVCHSKNVEGILDKGDSVLGCSFLIHIMVVSKVLMKSNHQWNFHVWLGGKTFWTQQMTQWLELDIMHGKTLGATLKGHRAQLATNFLSKEKA